MSSNNAVFWPVHKRAPKFNLSCSERDINAIARRTAKKYREQFGESPAKRYDEDLGLMVYHYQLEGLKLLDEVCREYFKTKTGDTGPDVRKTSKKNDKGVTAVIIPDTDEYDPEDMPF